MRRRWVSILGMLGMSAVVTAGSAMAQESFEWRGTLERGRTIEIKGVNGEVRAVRARGSEVRVSARIEEGRRGRAEDVTIDVVEHADGVTVCAVYPSPRDREPNECRPGSRGRMNTRDNDTQVHFTVRVPAGVGFVGRTVNGDVAVESLQSDIQAATVNGDIEISTTGQAEATTVNGSIHAVMGRADWTGALEFETVNGSITVELPHGVGADVVASTVNGGIDTDFPLTVRGRFSSRRLSGTIGDGGRRLHLETVNGAIRIRQGGS